MRRNEPRVHCFLRYNLFVALGLIQGFANSLVGTEWLLGRTHERLDQSGHAARQNTDQ
jgi:hypothetical protein